MQYGILKILILVTLPFNLYKTGYSSEIKQIYTTNSFAPYSIQDDIKGHSGVILKIVEALQVRVSSNAPIKFNSWGRTQALAKTIKGSAIFPLVRNRKREFEYKWIGHIFTDEFSLAYLSKNKGHMNILSKQELEIGTLIGSFINPFLRSNGYDNLQPVGTSYQNIRKLLSGRIQYWATPKMIGEYNFNKIGIKMDRIKYSETLIKMKLYLAVSKDVSDETVALWSQALYEIKQDGSLKSIIESFNKRHSL